MTFHGLCSLCHGFGNLFCIQNGKNDWHRCPACSGQGTRNVDHCDPSIRTHAK